jgi:hypothetical protein
LKKHLKGWYRYVMRRKEKHLSRRVIYMNVEEWIGKGKCKKKRLDHVRQNMREIDASDEMTIG